MTKEKTKKAKEESKEESKKAKEEVVEAEDAVEGELKVDKALETVEETGAMDEEEYLKSKSRDKIQEMQWTPKTDLGRKAKSGDITDIDQILDKGDMIKESEIVDILVPDAETEFLMIGQSKGKFGGGKRKIFRQTQKKTKEGNKPKFEIMAIVGNKNGYLGLGYGKSKETVPSREKSIRNAKLNLIKIKRGCGSWQCNCKEPHSIPYAVEGKAGSVSIKLMPAPKGTGLKLEKECGKMLQMAGIKDVWGIAKGQTTTKMNLVQACFKALRQLTEVKTQEKHVPELGIVEGRIKQ